MLALDFREQKRLGDAIQDTGGWTAAAALFEPRVPSWTDVRALRDFLATQTRVRRRPLAMPSDAGSSLARRLRR